MAKYEDEHADPARNLYNEIMSAPGREHRSTTIRFDGKGDSDRYRQMTGGGNALRTRISNPGQKLLRQDAKLDEPDK